MGESDSVAIEARAIATMFGDKRIPLPAPLSHITEETQIVRPRPVVKLSKIDMRSPSFKQSGHIGTMNVQNVGSIDFVYEKLGRELDGNHVIDRKRDKEFEANCLCELERYHLQANRLQWHKDQSPIDIRADKPRDWAIFMLRWMTETLSSCPSIEWQRSSASWSIFMIANTGQSDQRSQSQKLKKLLA